MGAETINRSKQIREISAPSDVRKRTLNLSFCGKKTLLEHSLVCGRGRFNDTGHNALFNEGSLFLEYFQGESSIRNQLSAYCQYTNGFTGKENKQYHTVNSESQTMNER